ncbi:unnamed protein product [Lathyrus sativus]|nr:unnamed protein product [Lathyrus sativus]
MLKFQACLTVDVEGRSGGLTVMGKDTTRYSVLNFTRDFVNILIQDKKGIHSHPNVLCVSLHQAVSDYNLADILIEGHQFTWIKIRSTDHVVEGRLDRALATPDWMDLFPNVKLVNLITSHLDHSPILLHCDPGQQKRRNYMFKFESCWLKGECIDDVVQNRWRHGERICAL